MFDLSSMKQPLLSFMGTISAIGASAKFAISAHFMTAAVFAESVAGFAGFIAPIAVTSIGSFAIFLLAEKGKISRKAAFISTAVLSALAVVAAIVTLVVLGATPGMIAFGIGMTLLVGGLHTYFSYKSYKTSYEGLNMRGLD